LQLFVLGLQEVLVALQIFVLGLEDVLVQDVLVVRYLLLEVGLSGLLQLLDMILKTAIDANT